MLPLKELKHGRRFNKIIYANELQLLVNQWQPLDMYRVMVELQYGCGLRSCEVCCVSLFDFSQDFRRLKVLLAKRKDNKIIEKVVPDALAEKLKVYVRLNLHRLVNGFLFPAIGHGATDAHVNKKSYWQAFRRARQKAGLLHIESYNTRGQPLYRIGTHSLRRKYLSNLANSGMLSLNDVRLIAGHSKLDTTLQYLYESTQLKALEALACNKSFNEIKE